MGKVRISLFIEEELLEEYKRNAMEVGQRTPQALMYMALSSYLRNWESPYDKIRHRDGWPKKNKCPVVGCGAYHHPPTHHPSGSLGGSEVVGAYEKLKLGNPYD